MTDVWDRITARELSLVSPEARDNRRKVLFFGIGLGTIAAVGAITGINLLRTGGITRDMFWIIIAVATVSPAAFVAIIQGIIGGHVIFVRGVTALVDFFVTVFIQFLVLPFLLPIYTLEYLWKGEPASEMKSWTNSAHLTQELSFRRIEIPEPYLDMISSNVMLEPVFPIEFNAARPDPVHRYERSSLEEWFKRGRLSDPYTNMSLKSRKYQLDTELQAEIKRWLRQTVRP